MKIKIDRPHRTHVYLEIGRYSSSGYHASLLEGLVIAIIDIVNMWWTYDVIKTDERESHE
jgi:hypothetical protein